MIRLSKLATKYSISTEPQMNEGEAKFHMSDGAKFQYFDAGGA